MFQYLRFGVAFGFILFAQSTHADTTTYEFTAKNNSAGPMTIAIDGKVSCSIEAGKSCRLSFAREDVALTYSLAGGAPVAFSAGNIEATELCSIDNAGAHCFDPTGRPTN